MREFDPHAVASDFVEAKGTQAHKSTFDLFAS